VIWLNTNQYATGLALSLFGAGFSAFVGMAYVGKKLPERAQRSPPGLADIPFVGPALFRQHPMVYLAIALTLAAVWFLYRTRAGLVLRASASPRVGARAGLPGAPHPLAAVTGGRAVRAGRRLPVGGLRAAVGRGHDRRQAAGSRWR
jgi:general nucleoside transport system permease protein